MNKSNSSIIIITVLIIINISSLVFAQSMYLNSGQSGIGLFGSFLKNDDFSSLGGGIAISIKGKLDVGLNIYMSLFEDFDYDYINRADLIPYINLFLVKQSNNIPLSIVLGGSYTYSIVNGNFLDIVELDMHQHILEGGLGLMTEVKTSDVSSIIPNIEYSLLRRTTIIEDSYGWSDSDSDKYKSVSLGLAIKIKLEGGKLFVLSNSFSFFEDANTFGISIGIIK